MWALPEMRHEVMSLMRPVARPGALMMSKEEIRLRLFMISQGCRQTEPGQAGWQPRLTVSWTQHKDLRAETETCENCVTLSTLVSLHSSQHPQSIIIHIIINHYI